MVGCPSEWSVFVLSVVFMVSVGGGWLVIGTLSKTTSLSIERTDHHVLLKPSSCLTPFRPGGGREANWPIARFILKSSETVQLIFTKFCDFNYISYLSKLRV